MLGTAVSHHIDNKNIKSHSWGTLNVDFLAGDYPLAGDSIPLLGLTDLSSSQLDAEALKIKEFPPEAGSEFAAIQPFATPPTDISTLEAGTEVWPRLSTPDLNHSAPTWETVTIDDLSLEIGHK